MQIEKCPKCRTLNGPEGFVTNADGKKELLYRCGNQACEHAFSRQYRTNNGHAELYATSKNTVIETDC
ncbi:hypothetical protein [Cupriavidus numazuensis]|uniref:Zinc finger Ogr/Delta-type domain-containing protein n=1 Tax=Cupriavidus numazuensis TaxID=221992 RepID=A0ABM8TT06_9BURK|nr:hypothetical protein [Cupriavidus numazuensis]CAG2159551.1 hypothetical protein LMG26411_06788 [Cupriavidus numazuensis]